MKTKREETRAAWAEHLKRWRHSGLPRLEYCRENGIKDHQLRYWAGRVAGADAKPKPRAFAKAVVEASSPVPTSGGAARLVLPSGAVIEFSPSVEPSWIARVAQEVTR